MSFYQNMNLILLHYINKTSCSQKMTRGETRLLAFSGVPVMKGFPGRNVTDLERKKLSLGAAAFPALLQAGDFLISQEQRQPEIF